MNLFAVFFVLGVTWQLSRADLPSWQGVLLTLVVISAVCSVPLLYQKFHRLVVGQYRVNFTASLLLTSHFSRSLTSAGLALGTGVILGAVTVAGELAHKLDEGVDTREVDAIVRIIDLPRSDERLTRFRARIVRLIDPLPGFTAQRVQLSWYRQSDAIAPVSIQPGDTWQLRLRLKPPRGLSNPGGFDYAGWLFRNRIHAVGYVRSAPANQLISRPASYWVRIRLRLDRLLRDSGVEHSGVMRALVTGQRVGINADEWSLFRQTGTSHLLAISGLHVGMVAACAFFVGSRLSRLRVLSGSMPNSIHSGCVLAMLVAAGYSLLAGFTLPTQRALCMVVTVALCRLGRRYLGRTSPLALAAVVIVMVDPLAPLAPGFWLSFGAVAVLLYVYKPAGSRTKLVRLVNLLRCHLALALFMLPMTAWFFGQVSFVAPVANFVSVPVMSVLVVPPLLAWTLIQCVGDLILGESAELACRWLLVLADGVLGALLSVLPWLADLPWSSSVTSEIRPVVSVAALVGLMLYYLPACPERLLVLPLILPLLVSQVLPVRSSGLVLEVLDVGQGLAVLLSVGGRHLLYDTGGGAPDFPLAQSVIEPFLHYRGIRQLDRVLVSHTDLDHAGGVDYLRQHWAGARWMLPSALQRPGDFPCVEGQRWWWAGAQFTVEHPPRRESVERRSASDNNRSCVLRIRYAGLDILLPGDIEKSAERRMVKALIRKRLTLQQAMDVAPGKWRGVLARQLQATYRPLSLVVAPHHGSKTSSSAVWLHYFQPQRVVYPVGYRNRFGFPHETVQMRYKELGVREYRTDRDGALRFHVSADGSIGEPQRQRMTVRKVWH
ncbi:MAG: DNA internalization-related competence protein ComEC/Rec2 [Gammaproteobacteria bacterium]|nr:DNA internalization-related competence protein ComEC/Rec2 [Gammaproteobacteria bacterium]